MKELMEKKNDLMTRAEEVLNSAKAEKRELTDSEVSELAQIREEVSKIKETLKLDDDFRELRATELKTDGENPKEEEKKMSGEEKTRAVEEMETRAFENYIRGYALRDTDVNLTKSDNGAVIPATIVNRIIRKVYDICPILDRSQKFNVKGTLSLPYYPADSNNITVAYQEEFVAMASTSGKFASVSLTGYLAGALTKVSRSLVNNAQIDIVGFVVDEMALAIKRFIEHELLIGSPAHDDVPAKVLGLSTLQNKVVAESATAITADDVVRLQNKIKDEFQGNAIWIMSPATREALRLLKSNTGYYLLNDDLSAPFGKVLLGKPVFVSDNMPDIGSGRDVIYYGDMHGLATKFNENINIQVLREKYADEHALGIIGWFEFDAKVVDEQEIAKLTMATTST